MSGDPQKIKPYLMVNAVFFTVAHLSLWSAMMILPGTKLSNDRGQGIYSEMAGSRDKARYLEVS
jgi:hypothetical protein